MKQVSLRFRLLVILVGLTTITWFLSVAVTAVYSSTTVRQQIDRLLTHYADLRYHTFAAMQSNPAIQSYFSNRAQEISSTGEVTWIKGVTDGGEDQTTNYWFGQNQYVIGENSPGFPLPLEEGIVTRDLNGVPWRISYRKYPDTDIWLAVGVNLHNVDRFGVVSLWRIVLPLLVFLPVVLAVLTWGINRGLRPVRLLADRITSRTPYVLDPIEENDVPREILPIVQSLNDLLRKLERALESETRFTSNAAHELRTPLAAIQAEVQGVQRQFSDPDTKCMFSRISERVDRATETVNQLLTLARLDSDKDFHREEIDLNQLLMDEIADLGNLAIERNLEFKFDGFSVPVIVRGHPEWFRIMIRNLLLNALRHSTPGSSLEVTIRNSATGALLSIANDCEPIPNSEFQWLTDTFYRRQSNNSDGAGLGLSIVKRIATLHNARLELSPWHPPRGFLANVFFSN